MVELPSIPWLSKSRIRQEATTFLSEHHPSGEIPIPIELITERMGIHIVPRPNLRESFHIDGALSGDQKWLYIDERYYSNPAYENRVRFTLAHEVGHVVLHGDIFRALEDLCHSEDDWLRIQKMIPDELHGSLEWQASTFAGIVLVPTKHLQREYKRAVIPIRELVKKAEAAGLSSADARDMAWDSLAEHIAVPFQVSRQVVLKRLEFEDFSRSHL